MNIETLITLGYYISSLGFLIASILTWISAKKFGKSALGSIFTYLFIGTGIFFVITIFQKLGGEYFLISDESMDVWWHIMFYMALISYYLGFKALVGLGGSENGVAVGSEKTFGIIAIVLLIIIFIVPSYVETTVVAYDASKLGQLGLHHFISFILAGLVGSYLFSAKKNLGQIGKAVAMPMIIAVWALCIQHFWELLTESWAVIDITSESIEGVEKIFLIISAVAVINAALRLKAFGQSQTPQAPAPQAPVQQ